MKKVWSDAVACKKIREWIFDRDGRKCVICGKKQSDGWQLHPSHYWGRRASATRYDPENIDCFCAGCHMKWEEAKQGEYRNWKMKQLGKERYDALEKRFYQKKTTRREEILNLMNKLK